MQTLPPDIRDRLLDNGAVPFEVDHVPVLKLFNPCGAATWLITEMDADGDTLFGLADLGFGCPELGSVSLAEIMSLRLQFGLSIERDLHFEGHYPLSVYAAAARRLGRITEDMAELHVAAATVQPQRRDAAR